MSRFIIIILSLCFLRCVECPDPTSDLIELHEIPGTYVVNTDEVLADSIVLRPDSVYVHYYHVSDKELYVDSGKWQFRHLGETRYRVRFHDFPLRRSRDIDTVMGTKWAPEDAPVRPTASLLLYKNRRIMRIEYDWHFFYYYVKPVVR